MRKIFQYLGIEKTGWLELILALYPILAGYSYGSFHLSIVILLFLDVAIFFTRKREPLKCLPLVVFFLFVLFHDSIMFFILPDIPSYFKNSFISNVIFAVSVYVIAPQIDYRKFRSALYIVAIVCMIGMIYHVLLLAAGKSISPIKVPLMPDMKEAARLYAVMDRPTSFFWEPQSYASFMMIPLFMALIERKTSLAFIISILMIASTSTTGIILSILMFFIATIYNRGKWYTVLGGILGVFLLVYFLNTSTFASVGLDKFLNTEVEESGRISNGYYIATQLDYADLITGIPYANTQDAYEASYFESLGSKGVLTSENVFYVSAIWIALIQYGIFGLFLFVLPYFWIYKKNKRILPFLLCVLIAHFSNPDFIGAAYFFQLIFMLTFIRSNIDGNNIDGNNINNIKYANSNPYIPVC